MPSKNARPIHKSITSGTELPTSRFIATSVHRHDMMASFGSLMQGGRAFRGTVDNLMVKLSSAASPALQNVYVRICADAAGDQILVPDLAATLYAGITSTTTKSAVIQLDLQLHQTLSVTDDLYVFVAVDSDDGAPVLTQTILSWSE